MSGRPPRYRVLMLTDSLEVGGLERVVVTLSRALAERGHHVTVAAEPGGALWAELPDGVRRWTAPPRRTRWDQVRYFWWLLVRVRTGGFDIVHAHQRGVALRARVARLLTSTRVVEHVHNVFTPGRDRWVSFRGDRVIACGRAVAEMLVDDFGRPPRRIATIPNAVPDPVASAGDLELPSCRAGRLPTIAVLARVTEQKDPQRFIDVVSLLNQAGRRVNAVWVGDGDLLEDARAEVARRDIDALAFLGPRADVLPVLREADLVLLTSRWEGLPLSLLEGAAMGRPLAAPSVGSCPEVVEDGVNGVLFDVSSSATDIAAAMGAILEPGVLQRMGAASRAVFTSRYSIDGQISRVEEVYRDALAS